MSKTFNINDYVKSSIGGSSPITLSNTTAVRDYLVERPSQFGAAAYSFTDWTRDAASAMWRGALESDMRANQDEMTDAQYAIELAEVLLEVLRTPEESSEEIAEKEAAKMEAMNNLRKAGIWSENRDPNDSELQDIIDKQSKRYKESQEDYLFNKQEYDDSINNYDISQYYTGRANEAVQTWGNWFYKMPATMGTSWSATDKQALSFAGGWAGAKAGAALGSFAGPIGTGIGTVLGGVAGAQLLGGIDARKQESHMEAFMGYSEKVKDLARAKGVNVTEIANGVREQLLERGIDTTNMTEDMLIEYALSDNTIQTGSEQFNKIADEEFAASRRVYDRNNALGLGEIVSDLSYILPIRRVGGQLLGKMFSPVTGALGKASKKIVPNAIEDGMKMRFRKGLEIAAAGSAARNRAIAKDVWEFTKDAMFRGVIEGTEEGAQAMIVDDYKAGEYDEEYANNGFSDPTEAQSWSDLGETLGLRVDALGAWLGLNDEYKDDQQMTEEMWSGFLLSILNPQGLVAVPKAASRLNSLMQLPKVANYLQRSLTMLDNINTRQQYFKNLREGLPSGRSWEEALDLIGEELKNVRADGKTRTYNLDPLAITDGQTAPSNEDVDKFISDQKATAKSLLGTYRAVQDIFKKNKVNVPDDDMDLYAAIASEVRSESNRAKFNDSIIQSLSLQQNQQLFQSDEVREKINNTLKTKNEKSVEDYASVGNIVRLSEMMNFIDSTRNSTKQREVFKNSLIKGGFLSNTNALETAKITLAYDDIYNRLKKERDSEILQLREKHSELDESELTLVLPEIWNVDFELHQNVLRNSAAMAKALVFKKLVTDKEKEFFSPSQEFVEEKVAAYKDLLSRQSKLADNANAAARENTEPTKVVSPAQEKLVDMTKEQVEKEKATVETQVTEAVSQLESQLASIPEDSHLYSLVEHINKNAEFVKDNPLNYARYMSRLIKRMKWQYSNGEAAKDAPEEVKKQLEEIVALADNIESQVDQIVRLNTEARAKQVRHNAGLMTTTANSRIWEDENGNKYTVSREDIEYSENEGAIITLKPVIRQGLESEINKTKQQLQDKITKLQEDSAKNPDNKKDNDKAVEAFEAVLKSLQDYEADQKSKKIVLNAETARPWLESLKTVDNQGNVETFGEANDGINQIVKHVTDKIENNKKHRNEKANAAFATGDVFDYLTNDNSRHSEESKTLPRYKLNNVKWVHNTIRNIKSYALKDDGPINTNLLNPHHVDKFWNGHFTMQYEDPNDIKKFKGGYKFIRDGVEYNRVDAAKTYNKIGALIANAKANNTYKPDEVYRALEKLFEGSKEETILGSKITASEYWNMIYATPFQQYLYSPRTGHLGLYLVVADYGSYSRSNQYSQEERTARAEFVHTMLNTFKKADKKDEQDIESEKYMDVSAEEHTKRSTYVNKFHFAKESVKVYPGDFDYAMETVRDDRSFLYKNEDGTVMNNSQVQEIYDTKVPAAVTVAKQRMSDIIKLLEELNYADVTEDKLNQVDSEGKSNFYKLVEAVMKYGDGVLTAKSLTSVLRDAVGLFKAGSSVKEDVAVERARDLFYAFAEIIPDHFTSFKNPSTTSSLADYPVAETVKVNIRYRYFGGKDSIQIHTKDSNVIDDTTKINLNSNTEENIEKVTEMFEYFQKVLDNASTVTEFLDEIGTNYRFVQSGQESFARKTLTDYFYAVKFGRFRNNGNIAMVFSKGSPRPTDETLSYKGFNTRQVKKNNPLNKVGSLGLIKDENGRYHFSIKEWVDNNVSTSQKTQDGKKVLTEMEVLREEALAPLRNMLNDAEKLSETSEITEAAIEQLFARYEISASNIIDEIRNDDYVVVNDEYVLADKVSPREVLDDLIYTLQLRSEELEKDYQKKYTKLVEDNLRKDESFEGREHAYVHFAVGSFQTKDGVSIVYRDNQGNPHTISGAQGTPGAVYMILPGFFSPRQEQQVVKLNPAHLNQDLAEFVAALLNDVRTGKLKTDEMLSNTRVGKYTVKSGATVKTVLDQIVFNGTEAIINNPGAQHNIDQLLHIDSTNTIHFGEQTLNDENFDQLVEFLKRKPRRIDMDKVTNIDALNGVDLEISTEENGEKKSILSRSRYDNYSSLVIDEGLVISDLNARKGKNERVFAKPYVYTQFEAKNKLNKPVANNKKSEGSAANAKSNAEWQDMDDVRKQIAEQEELDLIGKPNAKGAITDLQQRFVKKLDELAAVGTIDTVDYKVAIFDGDKKYAMPYLSVSYVTVDAEAGAGFSVKVDDAKELASTLGKMKEKGMDKLLFYITDDSYNPIMDGNKRVGVWLSLNKIRIPKELLEQKQSVAAQADSSVMGDVLKTIAEMQAKQAEILERLDQRLAGQPIGQTVSQQGQQAQQPASDPAVQRTIQYDIFGEIPITLPLGLNQEQFEAEVLSQTGESIPDAYEEYLQQVELSNTGFVSAKPATQPVTFNNGGSTASPTSVVIGQVNDTKPSTKPATVTTVAPSMPTLQQLLTWILAENPETYKQIQKQLKNTDPDMFTSGAYMQYLVKHGMPLSEARSFVSSKEGQKEIRKAKATYQENVARLTSLYNFESEHVEKEDYQEALNEVKKILGNVNIEELNVVSKEYDDARDANLYVYGACGESAIYIYKTMLDGREVIFKGGLYHEAYHKVSLFILSDKDRQKIYKQARTENPELAKASDKMVEEWLADEFAARVLQWKKQGDTAIYSKNAIIRGFQKLYNFIKKIGERFKENHITDEHVDMNKLFRNMYKGRYAYAKATVKNVELFNKIYSRRVAYSGVVVNGNVVAEDAKQYAELKRHLLDRAISLSSLSQSASGRAYVDMSKVKSDLERDIAGQEADIKLLEEHMANPAALPERLRQIDMFALLVGATRRMEVLKNVIADGAWQEWCKNISQFVQQTFGIERLDANDQLENSKGGVSIDNSNQRDSYGRNMFEELNINMKAMLWCVVDGDTSSAKNLKYTKDGLWVYAKIGQLYNKIVRAVANSKDVEDMMNKLAAAAQYEIDENGDYTLQQFYASINAADNSETVQKHKNQIYTSFVRHIHLFENYVYESEEHTFKDTFGNEHTTYTYEGSVRSGNLDNVSQNIKNVWRRNLILGFSNIARQITSGGLKYMDVIKPLKDAVKDLKSVKKGGKEELASIEKVLTQLSEIYAMEFKDGDIAKAARHIKEAKQINTLTSFCTDLTLFSESSIKELSTGGRGKSVFQRSFMKLTDLKTPFFQLAENLAMRQQPDAKDNSQRGPGNTKVYSIGAYNFITRLVSTRMKTKEWIDKVSRDIYTAGSSWLKELRAGITPTVNTKFATIVDNEFGDASADIAIAPHEDMMNRLLAILAGKYNAPSLANKRFAASFEGFLFPESVQDVVRNDGVIQDAYVERYVEYLGDEILAIAEAMKVRENFINKVNEITGKDFTVESFSKLNSVEQENLFRKHPALMQLIPMLTKVKHFKEGGTVFKEVNGRTVRRVFHIDLRKGRGYGFRHFANVGKNIKFDQQLINDLTVNMGQSHEARESAIKLSREIARQHKDEIIQQLNHNIVATLEAFMKEGLLQPQEGINPLRGRVNILDLQNAMIPENAFDKIKGVAPGTSYNITGQLIYNLAAYYTIMDSIGTIEFEKLVTGDIAELKDITAVNKRYSGPCSTIDMTSEQGYIRNAFSEDRLMNSKTYNTLTINTSLVVNKDKFRSDLKNVLGIDVVTGFTVEDGAVVPIVDASKLIGEDGKFVAPNAPLTRDYISHRDNNRRLGLAANGEQLSNQALAERIVNNAVTRFLNYLNNDPTDAQVFISAEMFRQLMQRNGIWTTKLEACYDLLENYDNILNLQQSNPTELEQMCKTLGFELDELLEKARQCHRNPSKYGESYKSWIYDKTALLDATSLKYVYFGETAEREDGSHTIVYDKMSLSPIFKIFADGHQMAEVYNLMRDRQIDMIKTESAVKMGGIASFELFDENGNINTASLKHAPLQHQLFELLGKQLNTEPHDAGQTALLTQFMKIANMNIRPDDNYNVGENKLKGSAVRELYGQIIDDLTSEGQRRFLMSFGLVKNEDGSYTLDKKRFMAKLQSMGKTQDLPIDTLDAFDVDPTTGNFKIHPSAMPNLRWIQSRLISEMGKKVIDTAAPGMPLYQVSSVGYDDIFNTKSIADKHLRMPGENGSKHMEVKLSIKFFSDVIEKAKTNAKLSAKYNGLETFADMRRFILDNQELFALSYRVPTQGQNSTIPVKIIDVFPPQRGGIISFPAGVTAQTGSDFDIDKMFLARYNYTVDKNGKLTKVKYDLQGYLEGKPQTLEQKQNMLLDIYFGVLTSPHHYLAANTPLDVCTAPLSNFAKSMANVGKVVKSLPEKPEADQMDTVHLILNERQKTFDAYAWNKATSSFDHQGTVPVTTAVYEEKLDMYYLNPVFQTAQKKKNAGSDAGIGPMALNSVFRYFAQVANLRMLPDEYLNAMGISKIDEIFDRNGEDILDITSALINAHVDAVKDNYIGNVNVNGYTFSVTAFMTSTGFGHDTFAFLTQPILKDLAENWTRRKKGIVMTDPSEARGQAFFKEIKEKWENKLLEFDTDDSISTGRVSPEEMTVTHLKAAAKNIDTAQGIAQQLRYLNAFEHIYNAANYYSDLINTSQIDTKKYGKSSDEIISFTQRVIQAHSPFNTVFENPSDVFDKTFLGTKWEQGVQMLMEAFDSTIFEFGSTYQNAANELSKQYGKYGRYSKEFLHRVGPRLRSVFHAPFFNQYLKERFPNNQAPLKKLFVGADSVAARYANIRKLAYQEGVGIDFFDLVKYNPVAKDTLPQFFRISDDIKSDKNIENQLQASMSELFQSSNPEIRQWMNDFAVMMFYQTGGTDTNAGGIIKTTVYDIIPPQHLANITTQYYGTYNAFVTNLINSKLVFDQNQLDQAMMLTALTDDSIVPVMKSSKVTSLLNNKSGIPDVVYVGYGSNQLKLHGQGTFTRFLKVQMSNGNIALYKLGNILVTTNEEGRSYSNPLYFRVSNLGYRNRTMSAYSVRTDGDIQNGKVVSLFGNMPQAEFTNFSELDEKQQDQILKNKRFNKYKISTVLPAAPVMNYGSYINSNETLGDLQKYVPIDAANVIYYYNQGEDNDLKNYAEFKHNEYRQFIQITDPSDMSNVPVFENATVTLIGTFDQGVVDNLKAVLPPSNTYVDRDGKTTSVEKSAATTEKVQISSQPYSRTVAKNNPKTLYIFTDNTDRTSYDRAAVGKRPSETNGWYYQKYGRDEHGTDRNTTTAVLRGLNNAAPISTMKWFYKAHPGETIETSRWKDSDIEEFKTILDDEIKQIKDLWQSGEFEKVMFPIGDGFFNSKISKISPDSEIGKYLKLKIDELKDFINNYKETPESMSKEGEQRKKDCL